MRKVLAILIAVCLLFQVGAVTVFAENSQENEQVITISNVHYSPSEGAGSTSAEIGTLGLPGVNIEIIGEEWSCPDEIVIHGENIQITDGKYSYKLTLRSDNTLTFDNDLEIYYQGINGRYQLNYEIDETDNHIMTVTGTFENIIIESPLLNQMSDKSKEWILSHISEDTYFYQLLLRTSEGFTFTNRLRFLFDSEPAGYSTQYTYDLLTDQQSLIISGIGNLSDIEPVVQPTVTDETVSPAEPEIKLETPTQTTAPENKTVKQTNKQTVKQIIKQAANKFSIKDAKRIIKAGKTIVGAAIVNKGTGTKTFRIKNVSNKKYAGCFTIDKTNGKIKISPKTPRGRYVVTVQANAAQTKNCKASGWKTASVTIVVL